MQPKGYSKKTLKSMSDRAKIMSNTETFFKEVVKNTQLIGYQILHDKFGFGQKRIIRLEQTLNNTLDSVADGVLTVVQMQSVLLGKCGIDTKEEANKVSFRERFSLVRWKINGDSYQSAGLWILDILGYYFALLGYCLKTEFKFSSNQIKKVYWHIRDYINTLSRYKQFELTIDMIAECLMEECKYCDSRFVN